jgi:hypothetical protein
MHSNDREALKNDLFHIELPFPWELHQLLENVELDGSEHAVSWLPDGKAFKVHKPNGFCEKVMAKYFRQKKLKSFTRQVSSNDTCSIRGKYCVFSLVACSLYDNTSYTCMAF